MRKIIISLSLISLFYSGSAIAQTDTSGRSGVYRATHTKSTELKHTKLKVSFNYEKETMDGEEWVTASPYFYASDSLILDAKGMIISEVALEKNGSKIPLKHEYSNDVLKIKLDKTYQKNQDYTVYIKYTARPNEVRQEGSAAITDAKGLYFINAQGKIADKPVQIWTQGETESSSAWFPTIDKPNQKSTQEIFMTVPNKYVTLSNGILKSQKQEGNGLRTDHWVMDKRHAVYLFFMGVGEYAVVKDKWKNISVDYYVEKEYEPFAKQIFGNTPEMMDFFSKKLNYEYPWSKYAQIVARDYVSGAMENTTATIHGETAQQKPGDLVDENKWEDVIAHELFHHWFGDLVTAESWSNLTVNESFADYSEYLWNEYKYGKDQADYHLMTSLRSYQGDPANPSKDLVRFNYHSREDMFDGVSYNKGGAILHMLRKYLGDDAFFAALSDYLKTNEYGTGEAHQLRLSFEKISGKDLNWFFNQWYFGSGHPKISMKTAYDPIKKQTTVSVIQNQSEYFQFPITMDVYEGGKPKRYSFWVDAASKNDFVINTSSNPDFVYLNPEGDLLTDIDFKWTPENYFAVYQNSKEFRSRYQAVENAASSVDKSSVALKTLAAALKDPYFRIRMKAISSLDLSKPEQNKLFLADIEKLAASDPKTLVQSEAIAALAKVKDKKHLPLFEKGISSTSNAVKGSSLAGIASIDPSRVAAFAENVSLENVSEDLMMTLLPVIVQNKIESQMPAIARIAAFYPFVKMQNPKVGPYAEEGYNWIMSSDNLKATQNITRILDQVKGQVAQNPQAKMMIFNMLKDGVAKKMLVLKANPQSPTIHQQIDLLNKAMEAYK